MNKKTILIIEDEDPLLEALSDHLNREGFMVKVSDGGEEGLRLAMSTHPDLILLDLIMPDLGGIGVLTQLRRTEWGKLVPVIILTNLNSSHKEAAASELGVVGYYIKSKLRLEDLVIKIRSELSMA
jgi:two-component system response regulator RpaA